MAALPASDTVSLDDFYLGKAERQTLASEVHPLLVTRGVPGTHHTAEIAQVLSVYQQQQSCPLPVFDKGQDDRAGSRQGAPGILVFEGWCLGVQPQSAAELQAPVNSLESQEDDRGVWRSWVNEQISLRYLELWQSIDFWVYLVPPSFQQVVEWRSQAERGITPELQMSAPQLQRFIAHYQRLTEHIWTSEPLGPGLLVHLDADHNIGEILSLPG